MLWRVLQNSAWLFSSNSVSMLLALVQGILIARMLGVEKFGVFALITSLASVVSQLTDSRAWETAINFITRFVESAEHRKASAVVKLCYLVDTATALLGVGVLLLVARWASGALLKDESAQHLIQFYSLSLLVQAPVGTSSAVLRVANRFAWLAYQQTAFSALRLLGTVALFVAGGGLFALLAMYLATGAVGTLLIVIMSLKVQRVMHLAPFDAPLGVLRGESRVLLRFLVTTNLYASVKLAQNNLPMLLVGYWLSPADAGYFQLARKMSNLMTIPVGPLTVSSYPEFSRLWHAGHAVAIKRLLLRLTALLSSAALLMLVSMFVLAGLVVEWTVGAEYAPAIPVIYWMSAAMAIAVATNSAGPFLVALGRVGSNLIAIALATACQLTLLTVLVQRVSVTGAGISYLVFYVVWLAVMAVSVRNACRTQLAGDSTPAYAVPAEGVR